MQGWIKLHRQIRKHWTFKEKRKFSKFEAWIDLLMRANHKNTKILLGNELIELKRGQFVTSEKKLMEAWNWGKSKTRNFLELLENDGMIIKESDRKKTIITICNYAIYNDTETEIRPQTDHEQTSSGLLADTDKNDKNDKNEKNINNKRHKYEICDMRLAELLYQEILKNNPNHKKPNLEKWANDIRLMRERDERTEEQIEYLILWTQQHEFWHTNILSPSKLRKQWDRLVLQVKQEKNKKSNVTPITKARKKDKYNYNLGF